MNGFVQQYKDGGWISRWSSPGYANLMVGTSSDVAFADAYLKGIKGIDVQAAYDAAVKNASVVPPSQNVGRKGMDLSTFNGYTANTTGEGFSWSMDGYINDFGIANMSKALYDKAKKNDPRKQEYLDNYKYFLNRARNYVTLFDPAVGFFQGKGPDGVWGNSPEHLRPAGLGPRLHRDERVEHGVLHAAGRRRPGRDLRRPGRPGEEARRVLQYAGRRACTPAGTAARSTRCSRRATSGWGSTATATSRRTTSPTCTTFAGQPWKTQALVREALSRLYLGSEIGQGYPGDEDNGEMSAWYLFSSLGFYPLQVGSPTYAIGSPLFTKATVRLAGGKKLVISAPREQLAEHLCEERSGQRQEVDARPRCRTT